MSSIENGKILKKYIEELEKNFEGLVGETDNREERKRMYEMRYFFKKLNDAVDSRIKRLESMQASNQPSKLPSKLYNAKQDYKLFSVSNNSSNEIAMDI